jgi:DNA-binding transcriptional LysR family regulator
MNLQKLRAFRAVMATGGVTKAAERLNLTQPAVSRSILALSEEVGFNIFTRQRGRLVPTPQGEAFYRESERVLFGIDDLPRIARDIRLNRKSSLRIASMPQLARGLLPSVISQFIRNNPDNPVLLKIEQRGAIDLWGPRSQFDLGVVSVPFSLPSFVTKTFAKLMPIVVLPKGHALARKKVLTLKDIADEPMVANDSSSTVRQVANAAFLAEGLFPNIIIETSSAHVGGQLVADGVGISICDPFTALVLPHDRVEIRQWKEAPPLSYGFSYQEDSPMRDVTRQFMSMTVAYVETLKKQRSFIKGTAFAVD